MIRASSTGTVEGSYEVRITVTRPPFFGVTPGGPDLTCFEGEPMIRVTTCAEFGAITPLMA
jgi:hypothetical protein